MDLRSKNENKKRKHTTEQAEPVNSDDEFAPVSFCP
jgi:hypothetical protein